MNIFQILLTQPLTNGLIVFYQVLFHNMGLAIIGFSLFLRAITIPLTRPYTQSMKKMKEFEPQLNKLKKKYQGNQKGLMQAQAEFYKQQGIKPTSGCLPYLLQIVILIALFNVFNSVLSSNGDVASRLNSLLYPPLRLEQNATIQTQFLYLNITKPDTFHINPIPFPIPGPILILAALLQLVSAKITMPYNPLNQNKKKKKATSSTEDIQSSMQQSMVYTFPLMTLFIGLRFPSGLALYWLLFSLWQVIQQYATSGWGSLTPLISKLGLIKSQNKKEHAKN